MNKFLLIAFFVCFSEQAFAGVITKDNAELSQVRAVRVQIGYHPAGRCLPLEDVIREDTEAQFRRVRVAIIGDPGYVPGPGEYEVVLDVSAKELTSDCAVSIFLMLRRPAVTMDGRQIYSVAYQSIDTDVFLETLPGVGYGELAQNYVLLAVTNLSAILIRSDQ